MAWHVDDMKASHINPNVVTDFINWTDGSYGDDELGHVVGIGLLFAWKGGN